MWVHILLLFWLFFGVADFAQAEEKIRIVTTTSTLAALTREIVRDEAEIHFVAPPKRDVHFVSATPRDVLKVKKAQVFVHGGLDLEAWRDPLLVAAGNPRFLGKGDASIDASEGISLVEIPDKASRAEGDIHLYGNPHYWTDPWNGKMMVQNIAEGLRRIFPEEKDSFLENAKVFQERLDGKIKEWNERMRPYRGTRVVSYHNTWPYFARAFGLEIVGYLEPKPGIPPTAKHLSQLINRMKELSVQLILKEIYHESRTPEKVAEATGARVVTLAHAVGENDKTRDYVSMIEYNIQLIETALGGNRG